MAELSAGSGESAERVWCAADPAAATEEAVALAELLAQGFAYLTQLAEQPRLAAAAA